MNNNINLFYEKKYDNLIRLGDILEGFISLLPTFIKIDNENINNNFNIEVLSCKYSVVITPCCSIDNNDKIISITPLLKVRDSFFNNPYFGEDLTRINRQMEPEQALPPQIWEFLSFEEKQKRLEESKTFTFLDIFIYNENDNLDSYEIIKRDKSNITTSFYMINFRYSYKIKFKDIRDLIDLKLLQLSIKTRSELRDKISYYYSRLPDEDINP